MTILNIFFLVKLFIGEFCYRILITELLLVTEFRLLALPIQKKLVNFSHLVSLLVHRFLMLDYCPISLVSMQFEEPGRFGFDP